MSKAKGGFFDDDDDEDQLDTFNETSESYDTSNYGGGGAAAAAAGGPIEDSLSSTGYPSPPRRYQIGSSSSENGAAAAPRPGGGARASSITTAGRTGAAAAGSSTREYESTRGGSPTLDDILGTDGDVSNERNVQRLLRAWHNEMGAPELLTFPTRLVDRLVVDLSRRKSIVRIAQTTAGKDEAFYTTASILATENMRAAHVLKMYTRERIYKLEQCAQYYLSQPDVHERLYKNEIAHAQGYVRLVKAYHDAAAMDAMPDQSNRHPPPMAEPDFSKPVFFRALQDCPPVILPDGESFVFERGTQHMCRYSTVRSLLERGAIELI